MPSVSSMVGALVNAGVLAEPDEKHHTDPETLRAALAPVPQAPSPAEPQAEPTDVTEDNALPPLPTVPLRTRPIPRALRQQESVAEQNARVFMEQERGHPDLTVTYEWVGDDDCKYGDYVNWHDALDPFGEPRVDYDEERVFAQARAAGYTGGRSLGEVPSETAVIANTAARFPAAAHWKKLTESEVWGITNEDRRAREAQRVLDLLRMLVDPGEDVALDELACVLEMNFDRLRRAMRDLEECGWVNDMSWLVNRWGQRGFGPVYRLRSRKRRR